MNDEVLIRLLNSSYKKAGSIGHIDEEKNPYERNARNLITLWENKDCRIKYIARSQDNFEYEAEIEAYV